MPYRSIHQHHMPGLLLILNTSKPIVSVRLFQAPVGPQSLSFSWYRPHSPRTSACGSITFFISTREKRGRVWASSEHFGCYKIGKAQAISRKQASGNKTTCIRFQRSRKLFYTHLANWRDGKRNSNLRVKESRLTSVPVTGHERSRVTKWAR